MCIILWKRGWGGSKIWFFLKGNRGNKKFGNHCPNLYILGGLTIMTENRDVIEYHLAMLWRHWRAFARKLKGFERTTVITRTILNLENYCMTFFLMTASKWWSKMMNRCTFGLSDDIQYCLTEIVDVLQ